MCSDCASVPMRGSRFAGLLSMRKTTVRGSAAWRAAARQAQQRRQREQNAGRPVYAYVTWPRTTGHFAPVAAGTFPGS